MFIYTEAGFTADKKMLGWVRGGMTGLTALYFAQACGTTYSTLTDSHAGILSHSLPGAVNLRLKIYFSAGSYF